MNRQDFIDELSRIPAADQASLLSLVGHELTILARSAYEFQGPGVTNPRLLRVVNEIQHRIHGQVFSLLRREAPAFPAEALASWLHGEGKPHLQGELAHAFQRALQRFRSVA